MTTRRREAHLLRALAASRDRAADWYEAAAAGRPVDDAGPIPVWMVPAMHPRMLRAFANAERHGAMQARAAANQILMTRPHRKDPR